VEGGGKGKRGGGGGWGGGGGGGGGGGEQTLDLPARISFSETTNLLIASSV